MGNHIWITNLQLKISRNPNLLKKIKNCKISLYLFGSAKTKKNPNDLDILLIYEQNRLGFEELLRVKKEIMEFLICNFQLEIDLLILSDEEEAEVNFIGSEEAILIIK